MLVHSRKRFSEQRGRNSESVGHHRVNDRPQCWQGSGAASLNEDADRAANNEAAAFSDPPPEAFVDEEQVSMQPFGQENGRSLADVQPEVSRRQFAVYDANPRGRLQRVETRC